jgi:hypothetical protein
MKKGFLLGYKNMRLVSRLYGITFANNNSIQVKQIFILAIFFLAISGKAQELNFSVKWGKEIEAPRRSWLNDIVGYDASGIYAVKASDDFFSKDYEFTLEHYDTEYSLTKSFDLEIVEGKQKAKINKTIYLKNKLFVFYTIIDQKNGKNTLFAKELDKQTLQPKEGNKTIRQFNSWGKNKNTNSKSYFRFSKDSSKVLVAFGLPYNEGEPESFGFVVLNHQMDILWQKNIQIPYKDELMDIKSFRVDNQGNAYLLGAVYKEKRKDKRKGLPNYNYEIFACRDNGNTIKQYPIALDDRFLTDMQIEILDSQSIICAGFYSEKGTVSIKGTYFLVLDANDKSIKTKSFKSFELDFITQNLSDKEVKKTMRKQDRGNEPELYEYDLDKLLIGKDGSAILIGEQFFVRTDRSFISSGASITTQHYYYNDIIAVKISPLGEIMWTQKIPKSQHTVDDGGFYSSYALAIVNGKICFIFNDSPKNIGMTKQERPANYVPTGSVVVIASIDQNGNLMKQPIFNSTDLAVITRPKVCEQISNHEVILFGQRKKSQQFALVTFD